jgi:CRISPR-associated exonuclease Cas4
MYPESDLLMLSALQRLLFCERQCALVLLEGLWTENRLTAEGEVLHARVHQAGSESRRDVRTASAVRIRSLRLGVAGVADIVEFHRRTDAADDAGRVVAVRLPSAAGLWAPFPVEHKRGSPKAHRADEVQLCAQAICLEEMLGVAIPAGAIFYARPRRRTHVPFDSTLRRLTADAAERLHRLVDHGVTPPPVYARRCLSCSLLDICLPRSAGDGGQARRWLEKQLDDIHLPHDKNDPVP